MQQQTGKYITAGIHPAGVHQAHNLLPTAGERLRPSIHRRAFALIAQICCLQTPPEDTFENSSEVTHIKDSVMEWVSSLCEQD